MKKRNMLIAAYVLLAAVVLWVLLRPSKREEITLEDVLGPDWAAIVTEQVEDQLDQFPEEDKGMLFTDCLDIRDVVENREGSYYQIGFYLNEAGNPVVVFPKYTLGAGALGLLEFPITAPHTEA